MPRFYHSINDEVDVATKWWSDYPTQRYTELAKAQNCYDSLIKGVWSKPSRLVRSASYTNMTYIKETQHDYPIKRSTSVSSLAPSLALPQYCRQAERIVHTTPVYKPFIYDWYSTAYANSRFIDTQRELHRPLKRDPGPDRYKSLKFEEPLKRSSYVPYFTLNTKRIYNDERMTPTKSYLHGSQRYMDRYVSSRLHADDYAQRFAYSAYEWRKPQDHAFNRNFMYGERVYIPHARSNPHSYNDAQALRKLYKTTSRFRFA